MVSATILLKTEMLKTMRASSILSEAIAGPIFDTEQMELPSAWVSVTAADSEVGIVPMLASVHIWKRAAKEEMQSLAQEVTTIFGIQPTVDLLPLGAWRLDFIEVRLDKEVSACRAIVRFACTWNNS